VILSLSFLTTAPLSLHAHAHAHTQAALLLPSDADMLAAIAPLLQPVAPPGGMLDVLGGDDVTSRPHLALGQGAIEDPSFYYTPLSNLDYGAIDSPHLPMYRRGFGQALYDYNLTLQYAAYELSPGTAYAVNVTYYANSADEQVLNRLVLNGDMVLHDYMAPPFPMVTLSFAVPATVVDAAIATGDGLTLSCNQPYGLGTSGRCCQITDVLLYPL
jgi:hypothetical protein